MICTEKEKRELLLAFLNVQIANVEHRFCSATGRKALEQAEAVLARLCGETRVMLRQP
jgi:hypothetical protein